MKFCTGASSVKPGGFKSYSQSPALRINDDADINGLPTSHTCTYEINIPAYPDENTLRTKLLLAIHEGNDRFDMM